MLYSIIRLFIPIIISVMDCRYFCNNKVDLLSVMSEKRFMHLLYARDDEQKLDTMCYFHYYHLHLVWLFQKYILLTLTCDYFFVYYLQL